MQNQKNLNKKKRKRPPSAFSLYAKEVRRSVKEANPGVPAAQIQKLISKDWKLESPERRKRFTDLAKTEKEKMLADTEEPEEEEPASMDSQQTSQYDQDYQLQELQQSDILTPQSPTNQTPTPPQATTSSTKSTRRRRRSSTKRAARKRNITEILKVIPKTGNKHIESMGLLDNLKYFNNHLNRYSNAFFIADMSTGEK
jgi:hypothetical protein